MTKDIYEIQAFLESGGSLDALSFEELVILKNEKKYKLVDELRQNPKYAPKEKLPKYGERKLGNDGDMSAWTNKYWGKHETFRTKSGYNNSWKPLNDINFQVREGQQWKNVSIGAMFENTDSDTGCEDIVDAWSPEDVYSKLIWNTSVCKSDLFQLCVKGVEVNPGEGLKTQIRVFGKFGDPQLKASCECGSCASISFTTYPITIAQYNLEAVVCAKDTFDVGEILQESYIKAMSDSWGAWFDAQIYAKLVGAVAGTTESLPTLLSCTPALSATCCADSSLLNMYNAVNSIVASMREGTTPYDPDYMIISPSVAAIFKRMQTPSSAFGLKDVKFDEDGRLSRIAGLKVIEYCGGNSCCTDSEAIVAVIVDSSRAVGAIFGSRPRLYRKFDQQCNSTLLDFWCLFGSAVLDLSAIAFIRNPA